MNTIDTQRILEYLSAGKSNLSHIDNRSDGLSQNTPIVQLDYGVVN